MNPHSKSTPGWWILEFIDGFGAHLASQQAMQLRYDAKILTVKEEGDTYHYALRMMHKWQSQINIVLERPSM